MLSACCGFRKETIAGMRPSERDAPIPAIRRGSEISQGRPTAGVCSDLPKRPSPLVPAAAPSRSTADARMAAGRRSKLSRNAKKPIQSGTNVAWQCCSSAVFALGDGLVQQCADFLANDIARPTALTQSIGYFVCLRSKKLSFQGVKQRRQSELRRTHASHGQDQAKPWRSMVRRIRRRVVSYSTAVIS